MWDGEVVIQQLVWYVEKSSRGTSGGLKLYKEFLKWAIHVGAKRIIMTHLMSSMPDKLERFYFREGFQLIEKNYSKTL